MIRKKPALGLDPGVETGFPKKIMLNQNASEASPQTDEACCRPVVAFDEENFHLRVRLGDSLSPLAGRGSG